MTIASEIQRVQTNIANAYTSLEAKGATMPDARNSANLASTIDSVSGGSSSKYGVPLEIWAPSPNASGQLTAPTDIPFAFDGTGIKIMPAQTASLFNNKFRGTAITSFRLPDLTTIVLGGNNHFQMVCYQCPSLTEVVLPAMEMKTNSFRDAFSGCAGLTSVVVPFTKITGSNGCYNMFSRCTNLATVTFPDLTEISNSYACYSMFSSCTSLTEITFPVLAKIGSAGSVQYMFGNCTGLTKVSFPALTSTTDLGNSSGWMFADCSSLTEIHFRADMESTIMALAGYANKWGAANATVYFDL